LIEIGHPQLSISRQCELLGLSRSSFYYQPATQTEENLTLMNLLDKEYTAHPFKGSRRMMLWLRDQGHPVNRKRVQRLMGLMGLEAIYPKPKLSASGGTHKVFPYLLRDVPIERPDQVWSTDITYIPLAKGFMYLAAIIDWYSRYVISWRLSNTLEGDFCLEMLQEALGKGRPEVFNTDQGVQFTAQAWTGRLQAAGVAVSMDGRGRCLDNVFVERLWRSVKYEDIYLKCYEGVPALRRGLGAYWTFYNEERPHQSLDYRTPARVYRQGRAAG
jgi:putative transposase